MSASVATRWMIRRDMPVVLRIESECFEFPWTEDDFLNVLRKTNSIGLVADYGNEVAGFVVYELQRRRLVLLNLAVDSKFQRRGVGTAIVKRLIEKLSQQRRHELVMDVRESNDVGVSFLKSFGFRCVELLPSPWNETDDDAYRMVYTLPDAERTPFHWRPSNRIGQFYATEDAE